MHADADRTLLAAVSDLASLAGACAMERYRPGIAVDFKGDGSPVTEADRAAERLAREWLEKHFPGDAILGEEFGESAGRPGGRRWLIDPIDGTKSFVRGVPLWGTLIAVMEGDAVLAGAAAFPACGELVAAARGQGAWWNGARCGVSAVAELSSATLVSTDDTFAGDPERRERWHSLASQAAVTRTWGDCFGYLMVATGRAEVMMDPKLNLWDAAAVQVVIEEAGGVFTDWTGADTPSGLGGIATNAALSASVRQALCRP